MIVKSVTVRELNRLEEHALSQTVCPNKSGDLVATVENGRCITHDVWTKSLTVAAPKARWTPIHRPWRIGKSYDG